MKRQEYRWKDSILFTMKHGGWCNYGETIYKRKKKRLFNGAVRRDFDVCQLMEILQEYEEETPVFLFNDGGYTYGSITEDDIYLDFVEED